MDVPDRLNSLLGDRYRVGRELGEGGMATVYLAQDVKHRRDVAIKVLKAGVAAAIAHDRFLREIEIAARLNHPHIVALFDSGGEDGLLYYVMPRIEGESLRDHLERRGTLPLDEALRLAHQIASALAHAHRHGIVHRDIKPANVLLADGIAVVADFGIGKAMSVATGAEGDALTQTGLVVGTPAYMSPEQASGDVVDARSDLYSLACVLFEMLAGRPPFVGAQTMSVLAAHISTAAPPVTEFAPSVPGPVSDVIGKALLKQPDARYESAVRFAEALSAAAATRSASTSEIAWHVSRHPNNLPPQRTRFIGREQEIDECLDRLDSTRMLTLTGIGGSGKTRLALAVAHKVQLRFPDGVWFVDLAPLSEASLIEGTIAAALHIPESPGNDALGELVDYLTRRTTLIVLDNCEHLVQDCARIADRLLGASESLTILATSREALGVHGETVSAVKPLGLPPVDQNLDLKKLTAVESVKLFLDRAAIVTPGFDLSESNARAVAEICRRLDGIPLAIELAAARTRVLSVDEIRDRLDDRFRLLSGSSRSVMPRHQTLIATIQWSYDQLPDLEKRLFRMFSVFAGGWTLSSATRMSSPEADEFAVLDAIGHVIDKSLVYVKPERSVEETRYGVLETVKQYGLDRLIEAGEADDARAQHLETFTALAEAAYTERAAREDFWAPRLEADHDNLRVALEAARAEGPDSYLRLAGALGWFWQARSHLIEGREHISSALARSAEPTHERARALWGMGTVVAWLGDGVASMDYMQQATDIWRSLGDAGEVALALEGKGWAQAIANDYEAAESTLLECLRIQEEHNDPVLVNRAKVALTQVKTALSKVDEARPMAEEIVRFSNSRGDLRNEHFGWHFLADCALIEGKCRDSLELYRKSLTLAQAMGDRLETSFEVQGVGMSLAGLGQPRDALRLISAAKAEWSRIGVDLHIKFWDQLLDRYLETARSGLGPAAADLAWREGLDLRFDDAVAEALGASEEIETQG